MIHTVEIPCNIEDNTSLVISSRECDPGEVTVTIKTEMGESQEVVLLADDIRAGLKTVTQ